MAPDPTPTTQAYPAPEPEHIRGLAEPAPGDPALLTGSGQVVLASGPRLSVYGLAQGSAEAVWSIDLQAPVTALAESSTGLLAVAGDVAYRVTPDNAQPLACLPGPARSMVVAGQAAFVVVERPGRLDGMLLEINLARGAIASEQPLRSSAVTLSVDGSGTHVGLADGATFRLLRASRDDPCAERRPEPNPQRPEPEPCGTRPPHGPQGQPGPGRPEPGRPEPGQPAPEPCSPGQSGLPGPDGGSLVGDGSGVTHYPPGMARPWNPCRAQLFFAVTRLLQAGAYYVAADREAGNVAVLAAGDLRVLRTRRLRRGSLLLAHHAQPMLLVFDRATRLWERERLDGIVPAPHDLDVVLDPQAGAMTWVGKPMHVLEGGRAPAVGKLTVLVLPAVEAGQGFNDADLPNLARYLKRTAFDRVRDYYFENSFGQLHDIAFEVFGVQAGPPGGPVRLPKPVKDYYHPAYVGAHVDMVKSGLSFPHALVFDGRERMTLHVRPMTGGRAPASFTLAFCAALFSQRHDNFPVQIRFAGTETASIAVRRPDGSNAVLNLAFPAKTLDIADDNDVAAKLQDLAGYLDGVLAVAEAAAGITGRLFARPAVRRLKQPNPGFGFLVTTLAHAATTGPKLEVSSITYSGATDPLGINSNIPGRISVGPGLATQTLRAYLDFISVLAQEDAGLDYTQRRLADDPVVDAAGDKLVSSFFITPDDGGPGATMSLSNPVDMGVLFDSVQAVPNTDVTANLSETPRDFDGLINDAFTDAVGRMAPPGQHAQNKDSINGFFGKYQAVIIGLVDPARQDPADPDTVRPDELWNAGPSSRGPGMRAVEGPRTAVFRPFTDIQFSSNWNFVFLTVTPEHAVFCHELGHTLGFGDLYPLAGYRDDLLYMGSWAMMHDHRPVPHHGGYHKWQAGWIPDSRVLRIEPAAADQTLEREVLLVPVEHWRAQDALVGLAQSAFNAPDLPVVQLVQLDLGGDADVFGLIEARQRGVNSSLALPASPAVLVSNCVVWWDETRYAFNGKYRAPAHPLHGPTQLTKAGDSFDLGKAPELPAKGIVVSIVDRKAVDGVEVFRVKVQRQNKEFIDLYFESADPYYMNPDVWIDWTGDNGPGGTSSSDPQAHRRFPPGQPRDQGEKIFVPDSGEELHWIVARLRNRGAVKAELVKLNFSVCEPPGGGDRGNFRLKASLTLAEVGPGDKPVTAPGGWPVPAGFKGHTCVLAEIADWKIPQGSDAVALASDDVWLANNKAQKNVDQIEPKPHSPYEPVSFDFSVNNSGPRPETAYLEPDGLPPGMRLTIAPGRRTIAAGRTAIFRCKIELDERAIDASCRGDRDFRIIVWRVAGHSAVRWGGVQYKVRPRRRTATELVAGWGYDRDVELTGHVSPDPGRGSVRIRLAYAGHDARWVTAELQPGGTFIHAERAPADTRTLLAVALFEGNRQWSESRSPERKVTAPRPIT